MYDSTYWHTEKLLTLKEASVRAAALKAAGKKVVTVNGSFDILHAGHLDQLEEAKKQGDVLFVGLNSDASVREGKGPLRPLIPQELRAALLAALQCVDYVITIDAPYREVPQQLLRAIAPQVHVNGPDYGKPTTWIEWPAMQELGTKGYVITKRNDISTTSLLEKIAQSK